MNRTDKSNDELIREIERLDAGVKARDDAVAGLGARIQELEGERDALKTLEEQHRLQLAEYEKHLQTAKDKLTRATTDGMRTARLEGAASALHGLIVDLMDRD